MEIHTSTVRTAAVLLCDGRLNMVAAPRLTSVIDTTVDSGTARLVIDLTAVGFVDSSGLGALIGGLKRAQQEGGELRIAAASEQVRTVLSLTNLERILPPYETVEDALNGW